jgi:hypothetical protein
MKYRNLLLILLISSFAISISCKRDQPDPTPNNPTDIFSMVVQDDFDWKMTKEINLHLEALANDGSPLEKVRMFVYSSDPGEGEENSKKAKLIYSGFTNSQGIFEAKINTESFLEKIYVKPMYIGLQELAEIEIVNGNASHVFGGQVSSSKGEVYRKNGPSIKGANGIVRTDADNEMLFLSMLGFIRELCDEHISGIYELNAVRIEKAFELSMDMIRK